MRPHTRARTQGHARTSTGTHSRTHEHPSPTQPHTKQVKKKTTLGDYLMAGFTKWSPFSRFQNSLLPPQGHPGGLPSHFPDALLSPLKSWQLVLGKQDGGKDRRYKKYTDLVRRVQVCPVPGLEHITSCSSPKRTCERIKYLDVAVLVAGMVGWAI